MECRDLERMIDAYLDRSLSVDTMRAAETHLERCSSCGRQFGPLLELLRSPGDVTVPAGLRDRIVTAVDAHSAGRPASPAVDTARPRLRWLPRVAALAAAVVLFVMGWISSQWWAGTTTSPVAQAPAPVQEEQPMTVVLSPWVLSCWAQSIALRAPAPPVAFAAQATVMEFLSMPVLDTAPVIHVSGRRTTQPATEDPNPPSFEIPIVPPIHRLLGT